MITIETYRPREFTCPQDEIQSVINALINNSESHLFWTSISNVIKNHRDLWNLIHQNSEIFHFYLQDIEPQSYPHVVLKTILTCNNIENAQVIIGGPEDQKSRWYLCTDSENGSEATMVYALREQKVIQIEDLPLKLKFLGRQVMLCYEDCILPNGQPLFSGFWYQPDTHLKSYFQQHALHGNAIVKLPQNSRISLIRQCLSENTVNIAKKATVTSFTTLSQIDMAYDV